MSFVDTQAYYNNNRAAQRAALFVVAMGSFLNPLILSSVYVTIPAIATDFNANAILISWIPTSFLLTTVILMLPFGKLSDRNGRKRTYLRGIVILCLASLLASLAPNIYWLLGCRVLQGIGAAQTFGTGMAIITAIYPKQRRGAALGIIAAAVYIGLTSGPLLGGLLTEHIGWRSVFFFQFPLGVAVIILTLWKLKGEWKSAQPPPFDTIGALIFAAWAVSILLGLSFMPSWPGAATLLISAVLTWGFIYHQNTVTHPLIKLQAIRANKEFFCSLTSGFLLYAATFPLTFVLSLYLQYVKGLSPTLTGQFLIVQALIIAVLSPLVGVLSDNYETRILTTIGCLCIAIGIALLLGLDYNTHNYRVLLSQVFTGIGFGLFSTPNNNAAMSSLQKSGLGISAAILSLSRALGNMIGIGIVMMIIAINLADAPIVPENHKQLLNTIEITLILSLIYTLVAMVYSFTRSR